MLVTFKINTGTVKTGKNTQRVFREDDFKQLEEIEKLSPLEMYNEFKKGNIKNLFPETLELRDRVDLIAIIKSGIKNISVDKKVRGCFNTYIFNIN